MTSRTRQVRRAAALLGALAIGGAALTAAACGGTSSSDKTATASAKGGANTPAAAGTSAATKAAASPAAQATQPAASGAATTFMIADTSLGKVLTDDKGMTLYTFKNDVAGNGKSACAGGCLVNWPALTVASGAPSKPAEATGDIALITRDDGAMQVTYKGLPLYRFINDKAPGDTKGEGVGGIWFVAKP